MRSFFVLLAALAPALASAIPENLECPGGHFETTTSYVGKDNEVRVDRTECVTATSPAVDNAMLAKRQGVNVCGAKYDTSCSTTTGGGPDPNDCHVITDLLLYDSQRYGNLFSIGPHGNITLQYRSCTSYMLIQADVTITYCRTDWAAIIDSIASTCLAKENSHGGNCVATDGRWYIQVQHS